MCFGFAPSLGIQLQQSCLKLSEAHWTAKSTSGGFSVSFFWPAPENVKIGSQIQKKKRKRKKRGKAKAQKTVVTSPKLSTTTEPSKSFCSAIESDKVASVVPDKAHQEDVKSVSESSLSTPSSTEKTILDDAHEPASTSSSSKSNDESTWTQVSRKRRRPRLPPCWKLRFPAHLRDSLKTPTSSTESEDSEGNDTESSRIVGGSPTPVAARTRSRAKLKT